MLVVGKTSAKPTSVSQSSSALQEHSLEQTKFQFRCNQCNFIYSEQKSLYLHKKQKHADRTFHCDSCENAYSTRNSLARHVLYYHKNPGSYICGICNMKFNRKDFLDKHIRRHSDDKQFQCTICQKLFKTKCSLSAHVNGLHNDKRRYICDFCGLRTSWKSTYTEHVKIHAGEPRKYHIRKKQKQSDKANLDTSNSHDIIVPLPTPAIQK